MAPPLHLIVISGAGYASHRLPVGASTVGRSRSCTVVIDDTSVSRSHARIDVAADGTATLTDLGSANGSAIHGRALVAREPTPLRLSEAATVGDVLVMVQREPARTPGTLLAAAAMHARIEAQCRDADATSLPFRVVVLAIARALTGAELTLVGALARAPDAIGQMGPRELVALLDDTPVGRALASTRAIETALASAAIPATLGFATWPTDGRTATRLLGAATVATARPAPEVRPVFGEQMQHVLEVADRIAASDLSVLLLGETGTGKEVIATRIHERSARANRPFVKINCAALNEQLLDSQLFGHVRGAFTGADRDQPGLLGAADTGTLFLDEVADLAPSTQAKLLRVLEDRVVRQVGAVATRRIDVRFIAATNRPLAEMPSFRRDLYFRISGAVVELPTLRDRVDEILPLAHAFLEGHAARYGGAPKTLSDAAQRVLTTYPWPGNIRELRNLVERAAVLATTREIDLGDLPIAELHASRTPHLGPPGLERPTDVTFAQRQPDREAIVRALASTGGNQSLAADLLGVHRRTLMRWLDLLKISRPRKGA